MFLFNRIKEFLIELKMFDDMVKALDNDINNT